VDDETALERPPDSQPDERVTVDHQAVWGLAQGRIRSVDSYLRGPSGGRCPSRSDPTQPRGAVESPQ
jgi:hypothetical protein